MRAPLVGSVAALICAAPTFVAPAAWAAGAREGDVLKVFDRAHVTIQTNEESLARIVVDGAKPRSLKVVGLDEPVDSADVVVRLENRLWRPGTPDADSGEIRIEASRKDKRGWLLTLSAPDSVHLMRAIDEFRRLKEAPRAPLRHDVRALAIVPVGPDASAVAMSRLTGDDLSGPLLRDAHLLSADRYRNAARGAMDELILIDRSATIPEPFASIAARHVCSPNETIGWRERKPGGHWRAVLCAPTAGQLAAALRSLEEAEGGAESLSETPSVLARAKDLRGVRRIAVSALAPGQPELAHALASRAASALRSVDTFEVLERAGLSEVLAEIALSQAGITRGDDRERVQRLAAADAVLIIETTQVVTGCDYSVAFDRVTPRMGGAPSRPLEPSRLKVDIGGDPASRAVAEALLRKPVGLKTREEYEDAMEEYRCRTLPRWERQLRDYQEARRYRNVTWSERLTAHGKVTMRGSMRLVDLSDGSVLWEAPFSASESGESAAGTRTVSVVGEDSTPGSGRVPAASNRAPDELLARAVDTVSAQGIARLRSGALLPTAVTTATPQTIAGRLLDIDGETLLVGLGAADGIAAGDTLLVTLADGSAVRLMVTRVRPRTSDAVFEAAVPARLRAKAEIGRAVEKRP